MRVLDLFCCAGGASRGYWQAGFQVCGVDIITQPNYPYPFARRDALETLRDPRSVSGFDLIHASPPCQGYSSHVTSRSSEHTPTKGKDEPRMIAEVREALIATGKPYVIENVFGARHDLRTNLVLRGPMFGLPIARRRLFECSWAIAQPMDLGVPGAAKAYANARGWDYRDMSCTGKGRRAGTADRWKEILGLPKTAHMTQAEISECVPPAYTKYIGEQFKHAHFTPSLPKPVVVPAAGG